MTKEELIAKLLANNTGDSERDHSNADDLLLEYLGPEVKEAYEKASDEFWCA